MSLNEKIFVTKGDVINLSIKYYRGQIAQTAYAVRAITLLIYP